MHVESIGDKLILGINTTVIAMAIVFLVLVLLAVIIVVQSKTLNAISNLAHRMDKVEEKEKSTVQAKPEITKKSQPQGVDKGFTKGETKLVGVENEEHVAVIIAAVSNATDMPLTSLKIKSIKRVDDTWERASRVENSNQGL